jgi:beta-galactosidase
MKKLNWIPVIAMVAAAFLQPSCAKKTNTLETLNLGQNRFDNGWKFLADSINDAEAIDFVDTAWRTVDLPHDWSIEDLNPQQHPGAVGPFSLNSPGEVSTGHVLGGTGWYRKHFKMARITDKVVTLCFDGAYMVTDVWVNGQHVGRNQNGYTPFHFDITRFLNQDGDDNVVAVRVKNEGKNSRWYSGSGIYRPVVVQVQNQVHIPVWGTSITTPEVTAEKALVAIDSRIRNLGQQESAISLRTLIADDSGHVVGEFVKDTLLSANSETTMGIVLPVQNPRLWSCDSPALYKAIQTISMGETEVDTRETTFGIRSISFSAGEGFLLNGIETKLLGACVHHDNGILGAAAFEDAEIRRIKALKDNGYNAIRTSHNPPSETFLDACDRLGMLVINEAFDMWEHPKKENDYHLYFKTDAKKDLEAMLLRDRNHPSIIIWSIGNEIYERGDTAGVRIGNWLKGIVKSLDTTRPVTAAICSFWDHPGYTWKNTIPAFELLDVHGYNYQWKEYKNDTKTFPHRIIIGTESTAAEALENYNLVESEKNVIGDFIWTGIDYLGESGIGHFYTADEKKAFSKPYPWFNAWCGDIDILGYKKMQSYYRDVVWRRSQLEMAVHAPDSNADTDSISYWGWPNETKCWNWEGFEGKPLRVNLYSRCERVRLELNGEVMGEKAITAKDRLRASFDVPYAPGELKAIGIVNGNEVAVRSLKTTGRPYQLKLAAEKPSVAANRNNLVFINLEVTDQAGNRVPLSAVQVNFTLSGEATLAAAGTACPNCMESFTDASFTTFNGQGVIIVRSTGKAGKIEVHATAPGLEPARESILAN